MTSTPAPPPPASETPPGSIDEPTVMAPRTHIFQNPSAASGHAGPTHPAPPPEMESAPKPPSALALLSQLRNADPASVKKIADADAADQDEMTSIMLRDHDISIESTRSSSAKVPAARDKSRGPSLASAPPADFPPPPVQSYGPSSPQVGGPLGGGNVAQALQQAAHRATSSHDLLGPPRPAGPPPARASQPQLTPFAPPMTSPSIVAAAPAANPNATAAMPASAPTKGPSRTLIMQPVPPEVQAMTHSPFAQSIPMAPDGFVPPPQQAPPQQLQQQPQHVSAPAPAFPNYSASSPFAPPMQTPVQDPPEVPRARGPLWVLLGIIGLLLAVAAGFFLTWAIRNRPGARSESQPSAPSSASAPTSASTSSSATLDAAATAAPVPVPTAVAPPPPETTTAPTTAPSQPPPTDTATAPVKTADTAPTATTAPTPTHAAEPTFNASAARAALAEKNAILASCKQHGVTGPGTIQVTFSPEGTVSGTNIPGPPYAGTPAASCVISRFRTAKIAAFSGSPQTISYTFNVPK